MEKSGMKYEATLRMRMLDPLTSVRTDLKVYSIMKGERTNSHKN